MPVLLFILWIIFNGRVTMEIVLFGIAVSAAVYYFAIKVIDYDPMRDIRILKNFPVFILYILNLLVEIAKASYLVIKVALSRQVKTDPVIVEFDSGLDSDILNVILANSITLTPGTITVRQKGSHFVIHALRREYADGIESSSFVKLLKRFR